MMLQRDASFTRLIISLFESDPMVIICNFEDIAADVLASSSSSAEKWAEVLLLQFKLLFPTPWAV